MTGMTVEVWARAERINIESEGHFANPYNEFRARLRKSNQHFSSTETSALWKGAAIARSAGTEGATGSAAAVAEVAPHVASDLEEEEEGGSDAPEEAVTQDEPAVQGPAVASAPAVQAASVREQGLSLGELRESHFLPIASGEQLSDFEERMAQGLSSARQCDVAEA